MNPMLIVLGFCIDDASRAESLVDWIYQLNARRASGHALLVAAPGVHGEMLEKMRISAELAFESYSLIQMPGYRTSGGFKPELINDLWFTAAKEVSENYRWPWISMEPDSVPIQRGWHETIAAAYHAQPKPYFGPRLLFNSGQGRCLSRIAVYPAKAYEDLKDFAGATGPFHFPAGTVTVPRSTKSSLIQNLLYKGEREKIKPETVLLHGDKEQVLIPVLREELKHTPHSNGDSVTVRRLSTMTIPPKIDLRTKAGRALKAQQKATTT